MVSESAALQDASLANGNSGLFTDPLGKNLDLDVAVIGAGLSGINAGFRVQEAFPNARYAIFESRAALGGTWDLFRYPGIRSDSDLFTFGFPWRPWSSNNPIASREAIVNYLAECAEWAGIDKHIRYHHKVLGGNWSTEEQAWTLSLQAHGRPINVRARVVIVATGYYDYEEPMATVIPGLDNFKGKVVHPQFWPEDLDYSDKKVIIIGSGATAITLLPQMAKTAKNVTMLQRSPSYIFALPELDVIARFLRNWLPSSWAHWLIRLKYLMFSFSMFNFCQMFPNIARRYIQWKASRYMPDRKKDLPIKPHFDPKYNPWDQRVCACPDGDFFKALNSRKADIVTGVIETITEDSIKIKGQDIILKPDIIVTATGLKMKTGGGANLTIDGKVLDISSKYLWKGAMLQDAPNATILIGYTNASWTLGSDASSRLTVRLIKHMLANKYGQMTPRLRKDVGEQLVLNLSSTYIIRGKHTLPKAGNAYPWLPRGQYYKDYLELKFGDLTKDLEFKKLIS